MIQHHDANAGRGAEFLHQFRPVADVMVRQAAAGLHGKDVEVPDRGPRGRDEDVDLARQQRLEGFDTLARDLDVRLFGSEGLALGIQRRRRVAGEGTGVREPTLRVRRSRRDHDEHALWEAAGQGSDEDRGTGAGQPGHRDGDSMT